MFGEKLNLNYESGRDYNQAGVARKETLGSGSRCASADGPPKTWASRVTPRYAEGLGSASRFLELSQPIYFYPSQFRGFGQWAYLSAHPGGGHHQSYDCALVITL